MEALLHSGNQQQSTLHDASLVKVLALSMQAAAHAEIFPLAC